LILDKFRAIERPIDKYLTLRDLLRLAPKVYYDLLLKHTEEILPYIYTVSSFGIFEQFVGVRGSCVVTQGMCVNTGNTIRGLPEEQQCVWEGGGGGGLRGQHTI
jgi:hypothetical protein